MRLLAPRELIQSTESSAAVWVADQSEGVARLRRVTLGMTTTEGLVEITTGVNVGDRLIAAGRESLIDGERIRITGLDTTLGHEIARSGAESQ